MYANFFCMGQLPMIFFCDDYYVHLPLLFLFPPLFIILLSPILVEKLTKVKVQSTVLFQEALQKACAFFRISPASVSAYYGTTLLDPSTPVRLLSAPANASIRLKPSAQCLS